MATLRGSTYVDGDLYVEGVLNVTRVKDEQGNIPYFTSSGQYQDILQDRVVVFTDEKGGIGYSPVSITPNSQHNSENTAKNITINFEEKDSVQYKIKDTTICSIEKISTTVEETSYVDNFKLKETIYLKSNEDDNALNITYPNGSVIKYGTTPTDIISIGSTVPINGTTVNPYLTLSGNYVYFNMDNEHVLVNNKGIELDGKTWKFKQ